MPWEETDRKDGEEDEEYAGRMDSLARKHDERFARRDDESMAGYCDRIAKAARRDRARRADRARLDSIDIIGDTLSKLANRVDRFGRALDDRPVENEAQFASIQAQADGVYQAFGDSAARPMRGESLIAYRIRLLRGVQKHSAAWKDTDVARIAMTDTSAFDNVERMVYADAQTAARNPTNVPAGTLREIHKKRPGGGEMIEFAGEPIAWMSNFMHHGRTTTRIRAPKAN